MKESLSVRALDQRLQNVAGKDQTLAYRLRVTVANVVVGQMLPPGAVKGGTAMKIRLGESGSRFTPDLDTARRESLAQFIEAFEDSLATGWHGFTGRLIARPAAKPAGVPAPYVMQPYEVKLAFHGKSWHTVKLELGHNETGDADDPVYLLADDITRLFADVGLAEPAPIAVMRSDHQIAQKLHACTGPGNERARHRRPPASRRVRGTGPGTGSGNLRAPVHLPPGAALATDRCRGTDLVGHLRRGSYRP